MTGAERRMKPWLKKLLLIGLVLLLVGGGAFYYIVTEKFSDTADRKADFTVNAMDFIHEFEKGDSLANIKYREKIIIVNGRVSEIDPVDSTVNIKMIDTTSSSFIIFAFQQQHLQEAKELKEGDTVSIKGSFSGGVYSEILEVEKLDFKRCAINKK